MNGTTLSLIGDQSYNHRINRNNVLSKMKVELSNKSEEYSKNGVLNYIKELTSSQYFKYEKYF